MKRFLSFIVCIVMILSMMPYSALAEGEETGDAGQGEEILLDTSGTELPEAPASNPEDAPEPTDTPEATICASA